MLNANELPIEQAICCLECAPEKIVRTTCKNCKHDGCKKKPKFNFNGETCAIYCVNHKLENMIDIWRKRCEHDDCLKRPTFNFENEKHAIYCVVHKLENMINITHKKCEHDGCKKRPTFNFENEKKEIYCGDHKLENMIDIVNRRCKRDGCKKHPTFNFETEKRAIYCISHKLENMIDVVSAKCKHADCLKRASYSFRNKKKGIYCGDHKLENMIDIRSKICEHNGCDKHPAFNFEGSPRGVYCFNHKLEHMVNVTTKRCNTESCTTTANKKYGGYCSLCYVKMFPDKPISKNYKTKERTVVEFIENQFNNIAWLHDKPIQGGTSKRRPDLFFDFGHQILIIEIDENQHVDYSDEKNRILDISNDVKNRPIIFIRFNPDKYKTKRNEITSCWTTDENGTFIIEESKQKEWNNRLDKLKSYVDFWINQQNTPNIEITTIKLFYDEQ